MYKFLKIIYFGIIFGKVAKIVKSVPVCPSTSTPNVTILHNHGAFVKTRKSSLNILLLPKLADYMDFASFPTNVLFLLFGFLKTKHIYHFYKT